MPHSFRALAEWGTRLDLWCWEIWCRAKDWLVAAAGRIVDFLFWWRVVDLWVGLRYWFPVYFGSAEQCACGEGKVDLGGLIIGDGANFCELRFGEAGGGVEDAGGGGESDAERPFFSAQAAG